MGFTYEIEQSTDGGGTWTSAGTVTIPGLSQQQPNFPATSSLTVTGLTNGTTYDFRVSAVTSYGNGLWATVTGVLPSTIPGNVGAPTATRGDQQALLTWTAPSNGGSAITGYKIELSSDSGANWTDDTTDTGSSATSYTVNNLTNGTTYIFRVTAINANGSSAAPSSSSNAVTPAALPAAPSGLSATHGNGQVALSWTPGASSATLTGHRIEKSTDGGSNWTTAIADTGSASGSATVTGLTNGTAYLFRVAGISSAGTGLPVTLGNAVTPSTTSGAITGLTAQVGDQQVALSWTAPAVTGGAAIAGYKIEKYDAVNGWTTVTADTSSTATTHTVTGLTNGTAYDFRVTPINVNGASVVTPPTLANTVTPVAAPGVPAQPTAVAGPGSATITVTAGTGGTPASFTVTALDPNNQTAGACTVTGASGSCTITGLTAGTAYTFTATATNANSTSSASIPSVAVTPTAPATPTNPPAQTPPAAPGSVTATAGSTLITVSWTPPSTTGAFPVSMYRATAAPGGKTCMSSGTSCTITGLTNGVAYTVSVQALSGAGWGPAATSTSVTPGADAPGTPGTPGVLAGEGQLTVVVSAPADGGDPTSYVATASPGGAACTVAGASGSCVITGLTNGVDYTVSVVAVNDGGSSPASPPSATVTPEAPIETVPELPTEPVATGGSQLLVGGQPVAVEVAALPRSEGLAVSGSDFDMSLVALGSQGEPLNLAATGHLVLEEDRTARSEGDGFRPATDVVVTMLSDTTESAVRGSSAGPVSASRIEPRQIGLGGVTVNSAGTFSGVFTLPDTLAPGTYTLRVVGVTQGNEQRTLFLGVEVVDKAASRPQPPRDVTITKVTGGSVSLAWLAPLDDGGAPVTSYRIRVRNLAEEVYRNGGRTQDVNAILQGLTPGARYFIRVRAVNEIGVSGSSVRVRLKVPRMSL